MKTPQPTFCTEEHLLYLDDLRELGTCNMFGAAPYLKDDFPALTKAQAREILVYWMESFETRHPE
jgi:hypothetical protein